jgi:hypothetical protein
MQLALASLQQKKEFEEPPLVLSLVFMSFAGKARPLNNPWLLAT